MDDAEPRRMRDGIGAADARTESRRGPDDMGLAPDIGGRGPPGRNGCPGRCGYCGGRGGAPGCCARIGCDGSGRGPPGGVRGADGYGGRPGGVEGRAPGTPGRAATPGVAGVAQQVAAGETLGGELSLAGQPARLHGIQPPTLLIAARHDEMAPEQITRMSKLIPNARLSICERGSHMAMYDDQRAYFAALIPFLRDVHAGRVRHG